MQFEVLNEIFKERTKLLQDFTKSDKLGSYARVKALDEETVSVMIESSINSCTVDIKANVIDIGDFAIPSRELFNILNATTDVKSLMFISDEEELNVTSGDDDSQEFEYVTRVVTLETKPIEWKTDITFSFDGLVLSNMLSKAVPFVGSNNDRAYLKGVCWKSVDNYLVIQATDGKRACSTTPRKNYNQDDVPDFNQVTVPTQFNLSVIKAFIRCEDPLTIGVVSNCIMVYGDGITMYSSLIRERFPSIESLLSVEFTSKFSTQTNELVKALKKVTICCDDKTNKKIKIDLCANSMEVSAKNEDNSMAVSIDAHYGGKGEKTLYYNHSFLGALLSVFCSDVITFNLSETENRKLALFEDDMATYLIMGISQN